MRTVRGTYGLKMLRPLKVFLLLLPPLPSLEISLCSREGQGRGQVATDPERGQCPRGTAALVFTLGIHTSCGFVSHSQWRAPGRLRLYYSMYSRSNLAPTQAGLAKHRSAKWLYQAGQGPNDEMSQTGMQLEKLQPGCLDPDKRCDVETYF